MARNRKQKALTSVDEPIDPQSADTIRDIIESQTEWIEPEETTAPICSPPAPDVLSMHPAQRFHQEVQARIGNRICPKCRKPTFKAYKTKPLDDGSVLRNRACESCGHVADMVAPPEKPA